MQKQLCFIKKCTYITQEIRSLHCFDFATSYNNIHGMHHKMSEYSKALPFIEHVVNIGQCLLPINHPDLEQYNLGLEMTKEKL